MRDELFDELMESLRQAAEHAEGKRDDLRTTVIETAKDDSERGGE